MKRIGLIIAVLCLFGCGDPKSKTEGVPTVGDNSTGQTGNISPPDPQTDTRLPTEYLDRSVALNPAQPNQYDGFRAIFPDTFIGPTIGNIPLTLRIKLENGFSDTEFFLGVEDALGFSWAIIPYFYLTGNLNSSSLDFIFADSLVAVRVAASRQGDSLTGQVYYSTQHQCQYVIPFCEAYPPSPNGDLGCYVNPADAASLCRQSMNPESLTVKLLGNFSGAKLSKWVW